MRNSSWDALPTSEHCAWMIGVNDKVVQGQIIRMNNVSDWKKGVLSWFIYRWGFKTIRLCFIAVWSFVCFTVMEPFHVPLQYILGNYFVIIRNACPFSAHNGNCIRILRFFFISPKIISLLLCLGIHYL